MSAETAVASSSLGDAGARAVASLPAVDAALDHEIRHFLSFEAALLDDRRFDEWYSLLADDLRYVMPTRANEAAPSRGTIVEGALGHFDDDKRSMGWRVKRLAASTAWAEQPPSRTRHLVTNVVATPAVEPGSYAVQSCFIVYRNRLETEVDVWAGRREDLLRRLAPGRWQIAERVIWLDQSVLLAKNLSVFF